ncbi:MAG: ParB N-terminal domain-containing protein [Planctomycetaceae bacterium]|jgi:ParB-like chromosome segregation protein Spo0J|nr:ParB N-terminal domain-containing protein [Planctomycetaceae bacterium]MBT6153456.1 ParB N-terminal domain-containing protein [Planctomycetaceae bacterium]MBT6484712.1 ParB N-terminal domain-containing protein [Planctomycetaceae bacterium]MBT6496462.1 ParB N-terminal domain-containing protein [Planctomycetaceae bacterium]
MNLKTVPIDHLKPAPYNPRIPLQPGTPGYRRLERSLNEFQLVQPIVWNEQTGHIVGGHQRLEILKNQGVTEVEVSVVSLSLDREKALNVTLNNAQVGSDWDADKLVDLLGELNATEDFDATLTGFDTSDINDLLLGPNPSFQQQSDPDPTSNVVRVVLEVPPDDWEALRPQLDNFIANHNLTVHIKLPND